MKTTRRGFLKQGSALGLSAGALPWAMNLAAIGEAAAQTEPSDYKALVCIFMGGGNDHANTLVPLVVTEGSDGSPPAVDLDPAYKTSRQTLAYSIDAVKDLQLNPLVPAEGLGSGRAFALAPRLEPLLEYFNRAQDPALAVLLNVGTLIEPTTKAQYFDGLTKNTHRLPPQLFSHNDQTSIWQSSKPEGATSGWGGKMSDTVAVNNEDASFTSISVSGNTVFLTGDSVQQLVVSPKGPEGVSAIDDPDLAFGSRVVGGTLSQIMSSAGANYMEQDYVAINKRALRAAGTLKSKALFDSKNPPPELLPLTRLAAAGNTLASQLRMVAHLINNRNQLGAKRQVFFVSLGGFDTHSNLVGTHPDLIGAVGDAMKAFHDVMVDLQAANQVTTFTASEFGRTMSSNGDGSDHGWGSMHFVMGGAVQGGRFYGKAPDFTINGPDDVGGGRLLPSTPVEMLAASLARWMGIVEPAALENLMGNLRNFPEYKATGYNLGFLG